MIQTFVDDRDAQRRFARLNGQFAKMKAGLDSHVIRELEYKFRNFADRQFATDGAYGGERWAALKPRTIEDKRRRNTLSKGILRDSVEMYDMLTQPKHSERNWKRIPSGAQVVFRLSYFRHHQEGTDRMEARPVYPDPLPPPFINELKNTITGFLLEGSFA